MFQRLSGAKALIPNLSAQRDDLAATAARLAAEQAEIASNARFIGLHSVNVTDKNPSEAVLGTSFQVDYVIDSYDMYSRGSTTETRTLMGFSGLPHNVLAYLIEREPHKIPAKITRLAAEPSDAFERYFIALKRGMLIGNAYDATSGA